MIPFNQLRINENKEYVKKMEKTEEITENVNPPLKEDIKIYNNGAINGFSQGVSLAVALFEAKSGKKIENTRLVKRTTKGSKMLDWEPLVEEFYEFIFSNKSSVEFKYNKNNIFLSSIGVEDDKVYFGNFLETGKYNKQLRDKTKAINFGKIAHKNIKLAI